MYREDRPREKMMKYGSEQLKDHELLAILLRSGSRKESVMSLSERILDLYPKEKLLSVSIDDLKYVHGVDDAKACTILAALELSRRLLQLHKDSRPIINKPSDAVHLLHDIIKEKKEHFVVFYMNARGHVVARELISIGTINTSIVHPREVFEPAIRHMSTTIVIAHNHPSGFTEPSDADDKVTERLVQAGKILGIDVMDHVIVTEDGYFSYREQKML